MAEKAKKLTLRSFKISNGHMSENTSGILSMLRKVLTDESTIDTRKMKLNDGEADEDVMAYFKWYKNDSLLFGSMMCIIPATSGGVLSQELLSKNTITQEDVILGQDGQWQIKDHFFFCADDSYLVVSLPATRSIERFQTYLNFLLEEHRDQIIDIQPILVTASDLGVKKIKSIVIGNNTVSSSEEMSKVSTWLKSIPKELVKSLLKQQEGLDELDLDQLISAELVIKIKSGTKRAPIQNYEKVVGALLKPTTCHSGVVVNTDKGPLKGQDVQHKETVDVQVTDAGNVIYENLKLKMEQIIQSLKEKEL